MLATMFFTQMNAAKKLRGSNSSMRNKLYTTLNVVLLLVASSFLSQAQVLTASYAPAVICEGNNTIIQVTAPLGLPNGVVVTDYVFYHPGTTTGKDSTVNQSTQRSVSVIFPPGVHNVYVVARLSDLSRVTSPTIAITVYNLPNTSFAINGNDTQCFKNNNACLNNLTTRASAPSSPIVQYIWEYGDARLDSVTNATSVCHTYTFPSSFTVTLRAIDSLGCRKDTFLPPQRPIVIKPNIKPEFTWLMRKGPCFISNYLFTNKTPVPLANLQSYTWEFGDGTKYTATAPFDLDETAFYDTIGHDFVINGEFSPLLSVKDLTGCVDSIRYTSANAPKAIPKNIVFEFDIVTTKSATDFSLRDSVCLGSGNSASVCFKQTPISFASPGTGDFLWNFNDPQSQQLNFDLNSWTPCHTFVGGIGTYNVSLTISNVCPTPVRFTYYSGVTLRSDKYIDKYIYADNDTLDAESRPVFFTDTIVRPNGKGSLYALTYTGKYIMSGNPYRSDTLYVYKGKHERPLYYISNDTLLFKAGGVLRDTILLPLNFTYLQQKNPIPPLKYDTFAGYGLYGYGVRILGPFSRIEDPQNGIVIKPNQKNQCGPSDTVDFVNTAQHYKSRKMYRKWDFDDNFAPQCTSFSVPKAGFPPYLADANNPSAFAIRYLDSITYDNGKTWVRYNNAVYKPAYATFGVIVDTLRAWTSAMDQYLNSDHYFIANKQVYGGRMNCKFSYDSLPRHHYPNWDTVYRWYLTGHDFMPWDPTRFGNGAGLTPIHPADSMWWGKPIFLKPTTGEWSLTQGTGPAPFGLWVRIDTIDFGTNNSRDIQKGEQINLRNLPDPWRSSLINTRGEYPTIQSGTIEPSTSVSYRWLNKNYTINGTDIVPGGGNMTFYKYAFIRTISRCVTVRMNLQDSFNNETTAGMGDLDSTLFDSVDCKMEASVQLPIARADGRGMGKSGRECPGANPNVVNFELSGFGNLPGVVPSCGQTFILFNFDSLADRLDNTPCVLDGFMSWTGDMATPTPGTPSTTPGGRVLPAFWSNPNFTPAPRAWQSSASTRIVFHYGLNAPQNVPPPADTAQGWITVGIVIGSGCKDTVLKSVPLQQYQNDPTYYQNYFNAITSPVKYNSGNSPIPGAPQNYQYAFSQIKNRRFELVGPLLVEVVDVEYTDCKFPKCMSDTVWYHRFLRINNLTARFDVEPRNCKLRHKGEDITVHYQDSVQDDIKYSVWDWGDNTLTVDSFYYADSIADYNNGFYINGVRRVRYNLDFYSGTPVVMDSTVWPIRAPGGPYVRYYFDSSAAAWTLTNSLNPVTLITRANPPGTKNGEYKITDNAIIGVPNGSVIRWDSTWNVWNNVITIGGTTLQQTGGLRAGVEVDTVLATNFYRIFNIIDRNAIPGKIIVVDKCSGKRDTLNNFDTISYFPPSQIIDTALMFLPIKHTFKRTSWEVARKLPGSRTGNIIHLIGSKRGCTQTFARPVTIGIVDTFDILNSQDQKDTMYCENEPIKFVDSLRYFRFDCRVTELPFVPAVTKSAAFAGTLGFPFDDLQIDSADFWRQDVGDPRPIQNIVPFIPYQGRFVIDTIVPERVYWDFGDGTPIDSSMRPVHRYSTYGRYRITMLSKDSLGRFDTCYGYVSISKPVAKIGYLKDGGGFPKNIFNCGEFATFIDSSSMKIGVGKAIDSVKTNYWWFGENKFDTIQWQSFNNFKPTWPYRTNGLFRVKLVSESYLGCKDTTYDTVFIRGPRPAFRLLNPGDTIGCAPFRVKLVNMADSLGKFIDRNGNTNPNDTPTLTTYFDWGNATQTTVFGRRDTLEYIYNDTGTFSIFAVGSDGAFGSPNKCALVAYPDTPDQAQIRITIKKIKHEVLVDKNVICKDKPVQITNKSDKLVLSYSYVSYLNDTVKTDSIYKNQQSDYTFPKTFTEVGKYIVIARPGILNPDTFSPSAAANCRIPDTLSINVVYPAPLFSIDTLKQPMPKVSLINNSDTTINVSYVWTVTKDGASAPKFTYNGTNQDRNYSFDLDNDTGTFEICLRAFAKGLNESEGCFVDTCIKIKNTFNIDFEIPNVFTPNGDGTNDEFKVRTEGVQKFKLTIYNRWGGKVFESGDPKIMWNGKTDNTGSECPAGVYYYISDYQLRGQSDKSKTGSITLIR